MAVDRRAVQEICDTAVSEKSHMASEILFSEGKVAEDMYFVSSGVLQYSRSRGDCDKSVQTGHYLSEQVLWIQWVHAGQCMANTTCEVVELNAIGFHAVMRRHPQTIAFAQVYAERFMELIQEPPSAEHELDYWGDAAPILSRILRDVTDEVFDLPKEKPAPALMRSASRNWISGVGGRRRDSAATRVSVTGGQKIFKGFSHMWH